MTRDVALLGARTFDLLVVGGGIYGLIIAADAAQRGLAVALVERRDFGGGASFNHLRTIHGGLRYLQTLDITRARESVRERRTLARIAPHAVRPLPFVLPLTSLVVKGPLMMRAGLLLDAIIGHDRNDEVADALALPSGRVLSAADAAARFPELRGSPMRGAAVWHDYLALEPDRLTLAWALAASRYGAVLANYVGATGLLLDGRRIAGARVSDRLGSGTIEVNARVVVNATGADIDGLLAADQLQTRLPLLRAMNLVTRLAAGNAAIGGQTAAGRALFMVPWRGRALFGTAESPSLCRAEEKDPPDQEIANFVREVASAFPRMGLTADAVTLVHRGVVPAAVDGRGRVTLEGRQQVRDHAAGPNAVQGLISVAGTKYTTARAVAQQITDLVFTKLGHPVVPSRTAITPLPAASRPALTVPPAGAARPPWAPDVRAHLAAAYGPDADLVMTLADENPAFAERVSDTSPVIAAQLVWAARHEMAATLTDVVVRRTPLGALGHPGAEAVKRAATIVGSELKWDAVRMNEETQEVDRFFQSTGVPTETGERRLTTED